MSRAELEILADLIGDRLELRTDSLLFELCTDVLYEIKKKLAVLFLENKKKYRIKLKSYQQKAIQHLVENTEIIAFLESQPYKFAILEGFRQQFLQH